MLSTIKNKAHFLVSPSTTKKTGKVLNTKTGKIYTMSLKGLKLVKVRRTVQVNQYVATIINNTIATKVKSEKFKSDLRKKLTVQKLKLDNTLKF